MGAMAELRDELKISDIAMRYEGTEEVYSFDGKEIRVPAGASKEVIKMAIRKGAA